MSETAAPEARIAELEARLTQELGRFKQLLKAAVTLTSTLNIDELLATIMATASDLVDAETSSLLLADEKSGELTFHIVDGGVATKLADQKIPAGQGIAGWVLGNGRPAVVHDPASDPRFYRGIDKSSGFATRNLVAVPLIVRNRTIGVVEMINKRGSGSFTQLDVEIGEALASFAAVAIDNANMYANLTDAFVAASISFRL